MPARTPPLGWSSWEAFRCEISEERITNITDQLVSTGLRDAGYTYVNLDDCWMGDFRDDVTGVLVLNSLGDSAGLLSCSMD